MDSVYKGLFTFIAGLGLGVSLYAGLSSHNQSTPESYYEQGTASDRTQQTYRPKFKARSQKKNLDKKLSRKKINKPHVQSSYQSSSTGGYQSSHTYQNQYTDQVPTAPPETGVTRVNPPDVPDMPGEESKDEKRKEITKGTGNSDIEARLKEKEAELARLQQEQRFRDSAKNEDANSTTFASSDSLMGVNQIYIADNQDEEDDEKSSNGRGAVVVGTNNTKNDNESGFDILPGNFSMAGVQAANELLDSRNISMTEYINYMKLGLKSEDTGQIRTAIDQLAEQKNAEAFSSLAQFSATATNETNRYLDSRLASKMLSTSGLKFLSVQISNGGASPASQLAINTVGIILEGDKINSSLFDILMNDVFNSLNNLPSDHPSFQRGRQLSALIPEIVNS